MSRPPFLRAETGPRLDIVKGTVLAVVALLVAAWAYLLAEESGSVGDLFAADTLRDGWRFVKELLGLENGAGRPAFLRAGRWGDALELAYDTVVMSVLAMGLAGIGALLTVVPAARTPVDGAEGRAARALRRLLFLVLRAMYVFSRSVPELVWALLIIFVVTPGILAGALALAIHNFGIVGKLAAEVVEDLDPKPTRALRASGASGAQVLFYGVLPQVMPQFVTYLLYRWEVVMRTTIVVGFVAASGLGREFRLSMSFFQFTDVALILVVYFLLVVAGDAASAWLRRLAR
ncbi:MAG: ABC transporter permease subunit [Dehalococcoidia bacterium]